MANSAQVQLTIDLKDNASADLQKFSKNAIAAFDKMENNVSNAFRRMNDNMQASASKFTAAGAAFKKTSHEAFSSVGDSVKKLAGQVSTSMNGIGKSATDSARNMSSGIKRSLAELDEAAKKASSSVIKSNDSLSSSFMRAAKVSLVFQVVHKAFDAVTGSISAVTQELASFDLALREVASISPEVRGNFEGIRDAIIQTNPALGTTTEITKGLYEVYSSGIAQGKSAAEAIALTGTAATLAKAGLTDNATAVRVLTSALNAYGGDASRASEFSDILFKAVEQGQMRFTDLANAIGPVLPIASQLGMTMNETATAVATLTQAGFSASEATTALRSMLTNVVQHLGEFKAAGIDALAVLSGPNGFSNLLDAMAKATGGNVVELRKLIPDMRGTAGALALTGSQLEKFKTNLNESKNAVGSTSIAFGEIKKSATESFSTAGAALERLAQFLLKDLVSAAGQAADGVAIMATGIVSKADEINANFLIPIKIGVTLLNAAFQYLFASISWGLGKLGQVPGAIASMIPGLSVIKLLVGESGKEWVEFGNAGFQAANSLAESTLKMKEEMDGLSDGSLRAAQKLKDTAAAAESTAKKLEETAFNGFGVMAGKAGEAAAKNTEFGNSANAAKVGAENLAAGLENGAGASSNLGSALASTAGSTESALTALLGLKTATTDYDSAVQTAINMSVKSKVSNEAVATSLISVGMQFNLAIQKGLGYENSLRSIGATTTLLSQQDGALTAEMLKQANQMGMTEEQAYGLLSAYRENQITVSSLGTALNRGGVDAASLANNLVSLQQKLVDARDPAAKLKLALEGLKIELPAETAGKVEALKTALEGFAISGGKARSAGEEIAKAYIDVGQKVPAAVQAVIDSSVKLEQGSRTTEESLSRFTKLDTKEMQAKLEDLVIDVQNIGTQSGVSATYLRDNFLTATAEIKNRMGGELPPVLEALWQKVREGANSFQSVKEAASQFGTVTREQAVQAAQDLLAAFTKMQESGNFTAAQLSAAFEKVVEAWRASGQKVPANWQANLDAMKVKTDAATSELGLSLGELADKLGVPLKEKTAAAVEVTLGELRRLSSEGGASAQALAEKFAAEIEKMRAAGLTVGQPLLDELRRLQAKAGEEAKKVGVAVGNGINAGVGPGVEAAGKKIVEVLVTVGGSLNKQLGEAPKAIFQKFATGLAGITAQLGKFTDHISSMPRFDVIGMTGWADAQVAQINKASSALRERLYPAVQSAIDAMTSLYESTGQLVWPEGLKEGARSLGLDIQELEKRIKALDKANKEVVSTSSSACDCSCDENKGGSKRKNDNDDSDSDSSSSRSKAGKSGKVGQKSSKTSTGSSSVDYTGANTFNFSAANTFALAAENVLNLSGASTLNITGSTTNSSDNSSDNAMNLSGSNTVDFSGTNTITIKGDVTVTGSGSGGGGGGDNGGGGGSGAGAATGNPYWQTQPTVPTTAPFNGTDTSSTTRSTAGYNAATLTKLNAYSRSTAMSTASVDTQKRSFGGLLYNTGTRGSRGDSLAASGFSYVPGLGVIPSTKLAAATGRLDDTMGANAQRNLQRAITPMVRTAIDRRQLSSSIQKATK